MEKLPWEIVIGFMESWGGFGGGVWWCVAGDWSVLNCGVRDGRFIWETVDVVCYLCLAVNSLRNISDRYIGRVELRILC